MHECKTVTLRTRPLKKNMLSFYLDYYPGCCSFILIARKNGLCCTFSLSITQIPEFTTRSCFYFSIILAGGQ